MQTLMRSLHYIDTNIKSLISSLDSHALINDDVNSCIASLNNYNIFKAIIELDRVCFCVRLIQHVTLCLNCSHVTNFNSFQFVECLVLRIRDTPFLHVTIKMM